MPRILRQFLWSVFALMALQVPAHAGMLGAEAVLADTPAAQAQAQTATQAQADREKVQQFLASATLKEKLKAFGVNGMKVNDRVDSLTQEEVQVLAQQIDALPAGGALSDRDVILILLVTLLLVVAL